MIDGKPTEKEYTAEEIQEAANALVASADANAKMAAQRSGKVGYATVSYLEHIPEIDILAARTLEDAGHKLVVSSGTFLNSIGFPERKVVAARG
jgi:hypothetical protein